MVIWESLYVQVFCGLVVLLPAFLLSPSVQLTAQNLPLVVYAGLFASALALGSGTMRWGWWEPRGSPYS